LPVEHPEHGPGIVPVREKLVWKTTRLAKPELQCFAELAPLLQELLERSGFRVRRAGGSPVALPGTGPGETVVVPACGQRTARLRPRERARLDPLPAPGQGERGPADCPD